MLPTCPKPSASTYLCANSPSTISAITGRFFARTILLVALTFGFALSGSAQTTLSQFFQGFEVNNTWSDPGVGPVRVASGTDGIASKTGGFHGKATTDFTRWGGYNSVFPAHGYVTTVAIYLNVGGGFANNTRFDWDSAINDSSGSFRRDFIFNAGYFNDSDFTGSGPRFVVSASTNSQPGSAFAKNPANDPFSITSSGWYTFKHRFYDNGSGVLAVEFSIIDSTNATIHTWVRSTPSDTIATTGGNRYGWFDFNEFPFLAVDDTERANIIITIPVDDDGTASATDCDAADPAISTIQGGISASIAGDTVKVCPGNYPQPGSIGLDKSISLVGPNAGISPNGGVRVPEAIITGAANPILRISAPGNVTTIQGFKFDSTGVLDAYDPGLNITIRRNIFTNGITNGALYFLNAPPQLTIDDNRLTNAVLADNDAIFVAGNWNGTTGTVATITNNVIENTPSASSTGVNLSSVSGTVTGNQFTSLRYYGILLANNTSGINLANNTFDGMVNPSGPTVPSYGAGIRFYTPALTGPVNITGNTFKNSYNGIGVRGVPQDGGANIGSNVHANFNRFINNNFGISDGAAGTLDAANNWWGCNYGPGATGVGCSGVTNGVGITGSAVVVTSTWLTLTSSASPSSVVFGGSSAVTSKLTINSAAADTSGSGTVQNGIPASFTPSLGTVLPTSSTTTAGVTGTTFTAGGAGPVGGVATTIDGQTVNAPIGIYATACADLSIPTVQTRNGLVVTVPVNTSEMTGRDASSADFTITYNSAVLTPLANPTFGVTLGSVGSSNGGARVLTVANPSAGTLVISIFGANEFQGNGVLVNLNFTVIGTPLSTSPLNFSAFKYNEGTPCTTTTNGSVSVISGTLSGTVTYGNAVVGPAPPRAVPNVLVSAAGAPPQSTVTSSLGTYSLSGFGPGSYTITPTKSGGGNDEITGLDASTIAQFVVGIVPLSTNQQTVADVSGTGGVTSFDASMIAKYIVSLPASGATGTWRFTPVSNTHATIYADITNENYSALLMGDVTGNWGDPGAFRLAPALTKPLGISAGQASVSPNAEVSVPVHIGNTAGKGIVAYQFDLLYDAAVLTPSENPARVAGTLSENMIVTINRETEGRLKVVVFGVLPLNGEGVLVNLRFTAIGAVGATSDLTWDSLMLNEGGLNTATENGRVTVTEATPNEVSISGKLLTAIGQGVPNTRITLTGINGGSRTVISNGFGFYEFGNVEPGQTYTLSVEARRFTFTPVTVSVSNNLTHLDLIAQP
jgi:hypothetical protein